MYFAESLTDLLREAFGPKGAIGPEGKGVQLLLEGVRTSIFKVTLGAQCSMVESLTRDREAVRLSLTGVTALCP